MNAQLLYKEVWPGTPWDPLRAGVLDHFIGHHDPSAVSSNEHLMKIMRSLPPMAPDGVLQLESIISAAVTEVQREYCRTFIVLPVVQERQPGSTERILLPASARPRAGTGGRIF